MEAGGNAEPDEAEGEEGQGTAKGQAIVGNYQDETGGTMEPGGAVSTMVPGGDCPMPSNSTKMPSPQDVVAGSQTHSWPRAPWQILAQASVSGACFVEGSGSMIIGESGEVLDGVWVRDWHDEEW